MNRNRWVILWLLAGLLGGCALLPPPPPPMATYDLALVETALPVVPVGGVSAELARPELQVKAPSWLANRAMQYRVEPQPAPRRSYAASRWAAEPAEMLTLALERALGGGRPGTWALTLRLDEFIQVFTAPEASHALLVVRAELRAGSGEPLNFREFVVVEPAATADAAGGAAAMQTAAVRLAEELSQWLAAYACAPVH